MGAKTIARAPPVIIVTAGVTIMSIFVSLDTSFPTSQAIIPIKNTARGPPEPPRALQAAPTAASEYSTRGGAISAWPIARAITGPVTEVA